MSPVYVLLVLLSFSSTSFATPQIKPSRLSIKDDVFVNLREEGAPQLTRGSFLCPMASGVFEDEFQCDKYWFCSNGVATPKLCEDGLVFDTFKIDGRGEPCDSPYVVDCGAKTELQEPTFPNHFCPRRHGFFADPDPSICNVFFTCLKGTHVKTTCSNPLHFDEITGTCTWEHLANRTGCSDKSEAITLDGFTCPMEKVINKLGVNVPHPSYPNLEDCQKFFVCLNGKTPQKASCNLGQVFNELEMLCDYPENVPECDGWYQNDPRFSEYYYDVNPETEADPGKQDAIL